LILPGNCGDRHRGDLGVSLTVDRTSSEGTKHIQKQYNHKITC